MDAVGSAMYIWPKLKMIDTQTPKGKNEINDSGKSILVLPAALPVESIFEIFKDDPATYGERALWFLSYVYLSGLRRFKKKCAPVQIHSDTLQLMLGKKTLSKSGVIKKEREKGEEEKRTENGKRPKPTDQVIQYLYILGKISDYIEIIPEFRIGAFAQSYRLKVRKIKDAYASQQSYQLTSKVLIKAFGKLAKKEADYFKRISPAHLKIFNSVSEVEYNWIEAEKTLDPKHRAHHDMLKSKTMSWKRDRQERVYTTIGLSPRVLRKFLSWRRMKLWSVDITSSQLCLHVLLYPDGVGEEEKEKYIKLCESGQLYDYLSDRTASPLDMEDDAERRQFKDKVFGEIFYSHPENKNKSELREIFQREFPILSARIREIKGKNGQYKGLPRIMQTFEAEIVIGGVIDELKSIKAPLIPIHDCILTTKLNVETVAAKLREGFRQATGITPKIKIKPL